jgi:hypothetical protein
MTQPITIDPDEAWPSLPLQAWQDTYATFHMWAQIVGKTRLALSPMVNHWWNVTFYVTPRGLTTSPMPYGDRTFAVDFDFVDHALVVRASDGATDGLPLVPQSVADFYRDYQTLLRNLDLDVRIWPHPVEVERAIPFAEDREHASYDPLYAHRFWRVLSQADRVMQRFRGRFLGKCSPVHFFWGACDLAVTRFSGRTAPEHPGGAPNVGDWVMKEGYSHELSSCGFWPGGGPIAEPVFYAYAYPEPAGFPDAPLQPREAYYDQNMREFILPYEAVRMAGNPDEALLSFLQSTYEAAANLGQWDREALERASLPGHA